MKLPYLERRPELDALRGLFLVWMTLTHLPTRFSDYTNQPIGFVSAAEGFVFISALLVGRIYMRESLENFTGVRAKLWKRTLQIYTYHLVMLAFLFTVAAAYALHTHKAALNHLLNFYFAHPVVAIVGSVLLLYCPPLLDILPMYVTFLFLSPPLLSIAARYGWRRILAASALIWLLAQFGLRDVVHNWIVHITHLQIPLQETGAFNLFAWQGVWVVGLWIGARSALGKTILDKIPRWAIAVSIVACLFFIGIRHGWLGPHLTQPALGIQLDKWQLGWLRIVNLTTFTIVVYWMRPFLNRLIAREPFLTLGKASLRVFCAHMFFVFIGLGLLYEDVAQDGDGRIEQLHGVTAIILVVVTFIALFLIAADEVRKRRAQRALKKQAEAQPQTVETQSERPLPALR
ncbi:MAG: OpgC domain-containing protein [Terracidiphilus sp.]|jgi:hypothetical protein